MLTFCGLKLQRHYFKCLLFTIVMLILITDLRNNLKYTYCHHKLLITNVLTIYLQLQNLKSTLTDISTDLTISRHLTTILTIFLKKN